MKLPILGLVLCSLSYYSIHYVWAPPDSTPPQYYLLTSWEEPQSINPCLEPGVERRFQILAHEALEQRVSLDYTASLIVGPHDRLKRSELIMLCRIVSQDCHLSAVNQQTKENNAK